MVGFIFRVTVLLWSLEMCLDAYLCSPAIGGGVQQRKRRHQAEERVIMGNAIEDVVGLAAGSLFGFVVYQHGLV